MLIATSTEVKNNFGSYLKLVERGEEVMVTKNGKECAVFSSPGKRREFLTDSLIGVIGQDITEEQAKDDHARELLGID